MNFMDIQYMSNANNEVTKAKNAVATMSADEVEAMLIAISHALNATAIDHDENGNDEQNEIFIDASYHARSAARELSKRAGN